MTLQAHFVKPYMRVDKQEVEEAQRAAEDDARHLPEGGGQADGGQILLRRGEVRHREAGAYTRPLFSST